MAFFQKIDKALNDSLVAAGMIGDEHLPKPLAENQIAVDQLIAEGDAVEVDEGVAFEVLQTPGHSDCSLSFFEPGEKVLLVSDATGYYMPEHECWWPNYFADYKTYLASMRRLAGLGAEVLCLSGVTGEGVDAVLARLLSHIEVERDRLAEAETAPGDLREGYQP